MPGADSAKRNVDRDYHDWRKEAAPLPDVS